MDRAQDWFACSAAGFAVIVIIFEGVRAGTDPVGVAVMVRLGVFLPDLGDESLSLGLGNDLATMADETGAFHGQFGCGGMIDCSVR